MVDGGFRSYLLDGAAAKAGSAAFCGWSQAALCAAVTSGTVTMHVGQLDCQRRNVYIADHDNVAA
jgi:hypothetical protein